MATEVGEGDDQPNRKWLWSKMHTKMRANSFFAHTDRRERKFDRNNADGYSTYNSKQTYKNSLKKI